MYNNIFIKIDVLSQELDDSLPDKYIAGQMRALPKRCPAAQVPI